MNANTLSPEPQGSRTFAALSRLREAIRKRDKPEAVAACRELLATPPKDRLNARLLLRAKDRHRLDFISETGFMFASHGTEAPKREADPPPKTTATPKPVQPVTPLEVFPRAFDSFGPRQRDILAVLRTRPSLRACEVSRLLPPGAPLYPATHANLRKLAREGVLDFDGARYSLRPNAVRFDDGPR